VVDASGRKPIHVPPGEGEMRWVVGDLVTFKVSGDDAAGAFTLGEEIIPLKVGLLHTCTPAKTRPSTSWRVN
jgi:hypothetical protein